MNPATSWHHLDGQRCGLYDSQAPDAFPFEVVDELVHRYTEPSDWILDPFAGDGTVAQRCAAFGRNCLGIELDSARAAASVNCYQNPSRLIHGDCCTIGDQGVGYSLLLTSPPFYSGVDDDVQAFALFGDTLRRMLAMRTGLIRGGVIAVEVLNSRMVNQSPRNYAAITHEILMEKYLYTDEIVWCCSDAHGLMKGFDHFYTLIYRSQ